VYENDSADLFPRVGTSSKINKNKRHRFCPDNSREVGKTKMIAMDCFCLADLVAAYDNYLAFRPQTISPQPPSITDGLENT
jgi:hypothetical protein